ncbi:MAG: tRNA (adenosine(37)-N6)-threonylcarbamoyltransferase complex dimerization subunit type 1 TsaB [Spirochaetales bacterium]|uniref:tRNA (Adenosine(37)-N6)-threonylcarbamoyltransferase complex dimerization subunit type 1 TsaB n=1 Tax=Candidatus Thalassospirochaeta sargassi TaxID=3119039 RepID=A0AAJ1IHG0_9SPIO|nr:tRNA (adenosine(37)-N6)-threonylcarbamoyltransferase complex dimerization subunit type 1 TsaB [Spirochaetales bacterium]
MNILAFDTAGNFLSTGLSTGKAFFEENRFAGLKHSEYLLPSVNRLMDNAEIDFSDLDLIVCSRGPGSFTGLRIGMSTAKGLSTGSDTPVVSVNNLDALAYNFSFFNGAVIPVIDARKQRFYTAVYQKGERISEYLDISAEEVSDIASGYKQVLFTGSGSEILRERLGTPASTFNWFKTDYGLSPVLVNLGRIIYETDGPDPDDQGPFYIRLSDAELLKK